MYKDVLQSMEGVDIYPIISLVVFFGFFVGLIVWFLRVDKKRMDDLARLPLGGDESGGPSPDPRV